jgi:hypothetical protein
MEGLGVAQSTSPAQPTRQSTESGVSSYSRDVELKVHSQHRSRREIRDCAAANGYRCKVCSATRRLTLPSRGRFPACGLQAPLMSNVRPTTLMNEVSMSLRTLPLVAAVLSQLSCALSQEAPSTTRFNLREGASFLGFKLDPPENAAGTLPFDRPYSGLTKGQKAQLRSCYVKLGEADEPPYPLEGLRAIYDPMVEAQRYLRVEGEFSANVEVNAEGIATTVAILRTPNKKVTDFVAGVALLTKYKPAVCDGAPCAMGFPIRMEFKIR